MPEITDMPPSSVQTQRPQLCRVVSKRILLGVALCYGLCDAGTFVPLFSHGPIKFVPSPHHRSPESSLGHGYDVHPDATRIRLSDGRSGSVYEFHNYRSKDFEPFFHRKVFFTDDTVCTVAVADALVHQFFPN